MVKSKPKLKPDAVKSERPPKFLVTNSVFDGGRKELSEGELKAVCSIAAALQENAKALTTLARSVGGSESAAFVHIGDVTNTKSGGV